MRKLFNLLVLLFTLLISTVAYAAPVKFMAISDVHIKTGKNADGKYTKNESIDKLQKAVEIVNASNVDFVVFLGDNIDRPEKDMLVIFAKMINKINKPIYVICGNHDLSQIMGLDKKEYFRLLNKFSHNKTKKPPFAKRMSLDTVFLFMDGVNDFIPGAKGHFKDPELLWLEKQLKKYKNDKIVILQHFPIVEPYEHESHKTYMVENYLRVIKNNKNIIAVISGHYHNEKTTYDENNTAHISLPSLFVNGSFEEIKIEKASGEYTVKTKIYEVD